MALARGAKALSGSSSMRLLSAAVAFALLFSVPMTIQTAQLQVLDLVLPTDNDALLSGDGPAFYQSVDRDYNGVKSTPWEGGQYGFVRDPKSTGGGVVYTRFHEGIDIRSVHRDANGEPLDEVRAIADGEVVHVSLVPGYSNYGKYIVIEHRWDGSNYYSLYGHLSSIAVHPGDLVKRGQPVATMGYTGVGINQERAHLHLELDLMFSRQFESWYNTFFRNDPNHNGIYNGMNLAGIDVPRLYPWMVGGKRNEKSSWEVSFASSGVPLKVEPSDRRVMQPELSYVKKSSIDYSHLTRDILSVSEGNAHLTNYGSQLMRLLIYPQ